MPSTHLVRVDRAAEHVAVEGHEDVVAQPVAEGHVESVVRAVRRAVLAGGAALREETARIPGGFVRRGGEFVRRGSTSAAASLFGEDSLVEGDVEDGVGVVERVLHSIRVVEVNVEVQHPLKPFLRLM